ncbi:MAG: transglycosylase domain-containing protein [Clostridia bacterium]
MSKSENKRAKSRYNSNNRNKDKRNAETNKKKNQTKKGFWKRHRKLALFLKICVVLAILLAIIGAGAVIAIFSNDNWSMSKEDLTLKSIDTIIYDKDGNEIANVSGEEKRRTVSLSEIPKTVQEAYISIEDERFYQHKGVDIKRTLGATVTYVLNKGNSSYGGSTITQQLIKNLKDDKSDTGLAGIQRKIREMSRAYKVEKILSKDQILELYLNTIFVGSNVYGVELGSRYYFSKSVGELDLAESAFLAGINNSPNSYNPFGETDNSELIKKRTKTVLTKMKELGKITDEEYNAAKAEVEEGLKFAKGDTTTNSSMSYLARAALNQVIQQYAEKNDVSKDIAETMIGGGGYKIYTTQDSNIQSNMEEVYRSGDYIYAGVQKKDGNKINTHTQSAMVIIDHKNGYVVGCMGGLGDDVDSNGQNRATQSVRQPGSSMKPIASIAPALESGIITAATIYDESSTDFGSYHPTSSGLGLITVRKAIEKSANTTEVKIMSELGPSNSIAFLKKMGITSLVTAEENKEHNDENLAMVLGGLTYGISPLEMAGAYAAIANGGIYITPTFYTRMEDAAGNIVLEPVQEKTRVMSEANAYIEQTILRGPVGAGGTAPYAKVSGQDTGGKTGTTTDNKDRWFCGFTPYYTAATWYGYDIPEDLSTSSANVSNKAARIWVRIMDNIHKGLESAEFEKPSNVVSATICLNSGKVATEACSRTYTEYFVKGTVPGDCEGHTKLTICKETGKIATEFCPDTEEKLYTKKPEKEDTTLWRTNDGGKYNIPTETCAVHTKKEVTVPNIIGKTKEEAIKTLKDLGLTVTVETEESSQKDGTVIKQSKKEGSKVNAGDSITITISKKKENTGGNENGNNEIEKPDKPENIVDEE